MCVAVGDVYAYTSDGPGITTHTSRDPARKYSCIFSITSSKVFVRLTISTARSGTTGQASTRGSAGARPSVVGNERDVRPAGSIDGRGQVEQSVDVYPSGRLASNHRGELATQHGTQA